MRAEQILELCAALSGVLYVYYATKERAICWAFYALSAIAYVPVFFRANLHVYAIFQLIFMAAGLLGLYLWQDVGNSSLHVRRLSNRQNAAIVLSGALLYLISHQCLKETSITSPDLLLSIFTVLATALTARKCIDSWHYWKAINGVGIAIALAGALYPTALFFLINFIFSFIGYNQWRAAEQQRRIPS